MARVHLDPDLPEALRFDGVALSMVQHSRRRGGGRRQQLRRLAGDARRAQRPVFEHLDFTVPPGQSVAVLGRKADGGSQLLRLAAGTLLPDAGVVRRRHQVTPILDGSGMLNGSNTIRQNIYTVGILLGMTPRQIADRLDWITEFAGTGRRLDAYLGRAPRRMRQRIVWTVSMATQARIFAIEHALTIGTDEFEAECWAHVEALKADGVTFLVIDDDPVTLRRFCDRALVLGEGGVVADTTVADGLATLRQRNRELAAPVTSGDDESDAQ